MLFLRIHLESARSWGERRQCIGCDGMEGGFGSGYISLMNGGCTSVAVALRLGKHIAAAWL